MNSMHVTTIRRGTVSETVEIINCEQH